MSKLPIPVREVLRTPKFEGRRLERVWQRVDQERSEGRRFNRPFRLHTVAASKLRSNRLWLIAPALALACGVAILCMTLFVIGRGASTKGTTSTAGPLRLVAGGEITLLQCAAADLATSRTETLSDGSRITLTRGAVLHPLENTGHSFVSKMPTGNITFDVTEGGPRRWVIDAGLASVEVVGTRFVVTRTAHHLRVEVDRGKVVVRGARLPSGEQTIVAGGTLDIDDPTPDHDRTDAVHDNPVAPAFAQAGKVFPEALPASSAVVVAPSVSPSPPALLQPIEAWKGLAQRGKYQGAYAALENGSVAAEVKRTTSVPDLLALADVARLSGHPAEAVAPLERILAEASLHESAPLAAFTLGKIELDALDHPARAATSFARAIALGAPRGFQEDAYARLVEYHARSDNKEAARRAAREYKVKFPTGDRCALIERWVPCE
ncbi:MAG: hypothetical protein NVSMB1_25150 [Polyangiales bacterium]